MSIESYTRTKKAITCVQYSCTAQEKQSAFVSGGPRFFCTALCRSRRGAGGAVPASGPEFRYGFRHRRRHVLPVYRAPRISSVFSLSRIRSNHFPLKTIILSPAAGGSTMASHCFAHRNFLSRYNTVIRETETHRSTSEHLHVGRIVFGGRFRNTNTMS